PCSRFRASAFATPTRPRRCSRASNPSVPASSSGLRRALKKPATVERPVSSILQPGRRRRRRWPLWAGLAALLVAGAALAVYLIYGRAPGNVSHPNVEFTGPTKAPHPKVKLNSWPLYGLNAQRTRYTADVTLRTP